MSQKMRNFIINKQVFYNTLHKEFSLVCLEHTKSRKVVNIRHKSYYAVPLVAFAPNELMNEQQDLISELEESFLCKKRVLAR